jgi:hypothetical protein
MFGVGSVCVLLSFPALDGVGREEELNILALDVLLLVFIPGYYTLTTHLRRAKEERRARAREEGRGGMTRRECASLQTADQ